MGKFNYIHKIVNGQHVYFFSNSSDEIINTRVLLRGRLKPQLWNPHTGNLKKDITVEYVERDGQIYTRFNLVLESVKSVFLISDDL